MINPSWTEVPPTKIMWEILVPTVKNKKPIKVRYHQVWDKKVREITNGLTILPPAKGNWLSPEGELFVERMIPVRIFCTCQEMAKIADFSATYYAQKAIMYYKVSDEVYIRHYDEKSTKFKQTKKSPHEGFKRKKEKSSGT